LKAEVDRELRTRRHLGYHESSRWAIGAQPVVDALADAVDADASRELVVLLERAVGHVVKVILRADDSDGLIGDLARRLLELHELACDSGAADPIALARWMIRFTFDDQDFFVADPVRYTGALGERGLPAYRQEVMKRAAASSSFAATYCLERLAVLDGDVDRIVGLLGGDLSTPHRFIRVVEALIEIGRDDLAIEWARRGIDTMTGWQIAQLFDLSAQTLARQGDSLGVLALCREHHQRLPSSTTYAKVKDAAAAVDAWPDEIGEARATLEARDRGGLVDALLADGDNDAAWEVVTTDPGWDPGEHRWQRLAELREPLDPGAALRIYLRLADAALVTADRRNYQLAARRLKAARRAAIAAGLAPDFEQHVLAIREQHRRRPTLIAILDRAGLR
jgi:uncharacterized Zn finger protein